jgi:pimeloyl-ACP methyl ester carboxylesterase
VWRLLPGLVTGRKPAMPYATNGKVRVYYEVEGSGPPLVLHIGFLGSLDDWRRPGVSYAQVLRDAYRLVLLDPRGQGRSDGPHEPTAYGLRQRVDDVLAVLDAEGIERAHFWGYSLGGRVGFGLGAYAPSRVSALVIGGAVPFAPEAPPEDEDAWLRLFRQGMPAFVADWEARDPHMPPATRDRWLALDAAALAAAWAARRAFPELADALPSIRVPALLYFGTEDSPDRLPEQAAAQMPSASVATLENLSHAEAFRRSDLVLPHVRAFLDQVARGEAGQFVDAPYFSTASTSGWQAGQKWVPRPPTTILASGEPHRGQRPRPPRP